MTDSPFHCYASSIITLRSNTSRISRLCAAATTLSLPHNCSLTRSLLHNCSLCRREGLLIGGQRAVPCPSRFTIRDSSEVRLVGVVDVRVRLRVSVRLRVRVVRCERRRACRTSLGRARAPPSTGEASWSEWATVRCMFLPSGLFLPLLSYSCLPTRPNPNKAACSCPES